MAHYLRWLCFYTFVTHSPISLLRYVSGKHEGFLSVQTPYVYMVSGKDLFLDCIVNGSSLSVDRVSWKHDGKWLHNQTQRLTPRVRLILRKITRQQDGLYQCSVFNPFGQSSKDGNVTVFIGDRISKPMCIPNGRRHAPKVMLIWNIIDDYHRVKEFTYSVWYCHKPTYANKYCFRPPYGFSIYRKCSDLSAKYSSVGSGVVNCTLTPLFMRLCPFLYDVQTQFSGRCSIFFTIALGNVHMPSGSFPTSVKCNPLERVRCRSPEKVHLHSSRRKTLSLVWDGPEFIRHYSFLIAVEGGDKNETIDFVRTGKKYHNISYNFTSLRPYTLYHIYIACSIMPGRRGEVFGPFSAMTQEEEPSDHPRIVENLISTVEDGEYRNVTFTWILPDKGTWNGIITRFVLHHSPVNSSRGENVESQVEVFSNVSNNTATVTGLRLDEAYNVTLRMCTRVGCGPTSVPIYISEMPLEDGTVQASRKEGESSSLLIVGLTLGAVPVLIVLSIVVAYHWTKRKYRSRIKKEQLSKVLGDLTPPPQYEVCKEPAKDEDSGVYYETCAPLLCDETPDYVQIRTTNQTVLLVQRTS